MTCDAHKGNFEFKKLKSCQPDTLQSNFLIDAKTLDVKNDLLYTSNLNCWSVSLLIEQKIVLDSLISAIHRGTGDDKNLIFGYCIFDTGIKAL